MTDKTDSKEREAPDDGQLVAIYKQANGEDVGKAQPLTTKRIISAMRAAFQAGRASLAANAGSEPVAWKHDCAALLANDVELWIDACPHCGKPRMHATQAAHTSPPEGSAPAAPPMDGEIALIEKAVKRVGIKSLLNHGAGSLVYSEGVAGVTQDDMLAYTREIALHCAVALGSPPEGMAGWMPIETAPKNSGYLLLRGGREQDVASGYWLQAAYAGNGAWIWPFVHMTPRFWAHLPPTSSANSGKGE